MIEGSMFVEGKTVDEVTVFRALRRGCAFVWVLAAMVLAVWSWVLWLALGDEVYGAERKWLILVSFLVTALAMVTCVSVFVALMFSVESLIVDRRLLIADC